MKVTHGLYIIFLFAAVNFLFSGCSHDDYIQEPNGVKVFFKVIPMLKISADTLQIEEAFIGIEEIDFIPEGETDTVISEKIIYEGPYAVDLVNGIVTPGMKWIFAKPGLYRQIKIKTSNALPGHNSINIKGTILSGDQSGEIPFELIADGEYELSIANNSGVEVRKGETLELIILFDLSKLLSDINLNSAEKTDRGVLLVWDKPETNLLMAHMKEFGSFLIYDDFSPEIWEDEYYNKDKPVNNDGGEYEDNGTGNNDTDNLQDGNDSNSNNGSGNDEGQYSEDPEVDSEDNPADITNNEQQNNNESNDSGNKPENVNEDREVNEPEDEVDNIGLDTVDENNGAGDTSDGGVNDNKGNSGKGKSNNKGKPDDKGKSHDKEKPGRGKNK